MTSVHEPLESRRLLAATPLVSGRSITSSISSVGEIDEYSISVTATQRTLVLALGETAGGSSFGARAELIAPSGSSDSSIVFFGTQTINIGKSGNDDFKPGTYTVRITDLTDDATGSYRLTAFTRGAQQDDDSNDFSDTTDSESATSGRRYAATAEPGDLDVWAIDVVKGQTISVTVSENDANAVIDPTAFIIDAGGKLLERPRDGEGFRYVHIVQQTGTLYAVVADGSSNATGVYGIAFTRVPGPQYTGDPDTAPLAPNVTRDADLPAGDADVFAVYLEPTQSIDVDVTPGSGSSLDVRMNLYNPAGRLIRTVGPSSTPGGTVSVAAPADAGGTYYVAIYDEQADDGGTYRIGYTLGGTGASVGTAPANGRLRIDATTGNDAIIVRRETINGIDALGVRINGVERTYYAPEVEQLALYADNGADKITLTASNIRTYVSAGSGDDTVNGSSGNDSLTGGAGNNRLYGGDGDDRLTGSSGRDILHGEGGNDRLYGGSGDDALDGGGNVDRLFGNDGVDELFGGNGNDKLYGGAGADTLSGGRGRDLMRGDDGDDLFRARDRERDELFGGNGFDSIFELDFDYEAGGDVFPDDDVEGRPVVD